MIFILEYLGSNLAQNNGYPYVSIRAFLASLANAWIIRQLIQDRTLTNLFQFIIHQSLCQLTVYNLDIVRVGNPPPPQG
jgi:hypothetical protein